MKTLMDKIEDFAALIQEQTQRHYQEQGYSWNGWENNCKTEVKPGRKYIKIDVGFSGKYMVDMDGNIYGIKAYGVINKKKQYGTVDTTDQYYWGKYSPIKLPSWYVEWSR